ncbi:MAG: hypothetical protein HKO53_16435 [Gemmatimonadetes bacterium]|nr:hypothetical protein [Gemmatimonadota bacterium]NNM34669.1 hypothetical protein [Gemmatimonadota bacterium]
MAEHRQHVGARHRHDRLWQWASGLFFGSLMVWFFGFVLGLARLITPHF